MRVWQGTLFSCASQKTRFYFILLKNERIKKMKKTIITKIALLMALLLVFALSACDLFTGNTTTSPDDSDTNVTTPWDSATYKENKAFGEGAKTVQVEVKYESHSVTFTIHTDAETLGEALLAHDLIAGEESAYGLYVKTVNGILADYDIDQSYWGFFKDGEYMMTGVDGTEISGGEHFELVYTK